MYFVVRMSQSQEMLKRSESPANDIHCDGELPKDERLSTEVREYVCGICFASFPKASRLRGHIGVHMDEFESDDECPPVGTVTTEKSDANASNVAAKWVSVTRRKHYVCKICNTMYVFAYDFRRHLRRSHDIVAVDLSAHYKVVLVDANDNKCVHCAKSFATIRGLNLHLRQHAMHGYKCVFCDGTYTGFTITKHLQVEHNVADGSDISMHAKLIVDKDQQCDGLGKQCDIFSCDVCGRGYKERRHLQRHYNEKHVKHEQPLVCDVCHKEYPHKRSLQRHKLLIHAPKNYVCKFCGKAFSRHYRFKAHEELHAIRNDPEAWQKLLEKRASQVKPICEICGLTFAHKESLKSHRFYIHKPKTLKCEFCDKAFSRPNRLKKHLTTHTGESLPPTQRVITFQYPKHRPQQPMSSLGIDPPIESTGDSWCICPICNKDFKDKQSLNKHVRHVHGEKTFVCNICEKAFSRKDHCQQHMLTHNSVKQHMCNLCDKAFSSKRTLALHIKYHNKEYSCSCSICGKGFVRKDSLRVHMKHHNKEYSYFCDICSKGFVRPETLRRHMVVHKPKSDH